jgi:AmmeMemoRadiSam system protein B
MTKASGSKEIALGTLFYDVAGVEGRDPDCRKREGEVEMTTTQVRRAVSAGPHAFYPSDPGRLRQTLSELFARAKVDEEIEPVALVCPHAGYVFSGVTAAHGYKLLEGRQYDRVIVLAPSHYAAFPGASIFDGTAFATPLGEILLDTEFIQRLKAGNAGIRYYPEAEAREHSLEVQLPFLQWVLGEFRLVPVVFYDRSYDNCALIADAIFSALRGDASRTLVVASSDLYHGPGSARARAKSQRVAEAVREFNPQKFCEGIEAEDYQACGAGPIAAAMILARSLGATKSKILDLTTSYDVHPMSEDYVVGYLSAVFYR